MVTLVTAAAGGVYAVGRVSELPSVADLAALARTSILDVTDGAGIYVTAELAYFIWAGTATEPADGENVILPSTYAPGSSMGRWVRESDDAPTTTTPTLDAFGYLVEPARIVVAQSEELTFGSLSGGQLLLRTDDAIHSTTAIQVSAGKVGIGGIADPTAALDVAGAIKATGTVSGALPTAVEHLTTKAYVDTAVAGGGAIAPLVLKPTADITITTSMIGTAAWVIILADPGASAQITVTLAAASVVSSKIFTVMNIGDNANKVVVDTSGGTFIGGVGSDPTTLVDGVSIKVVSDGTDYYMI